MSASFACFCRSHLRKPIAFQTSHWRASRSPIETRCVVPRRSPNAEARAVRKGERPASSALGSDKISSKCVLQEGPFAKADSQSRATQQLSRPSRKVLDHGLNNWQTWTCFIAVSCLRNELPSVDGQNPAPLEIKFCRVTHCWIHELGF